MEEFIKNAKPENNKPIFVVMLIVLAVAAAGFITGYLITKNNVFIFLGLMAIGILNIVNGFISLKTNKGTSVIFFVGGALLVIVMLIAIIMGL